MFLPLGDNITKRSFPFVGAVLIAVNVLVYTYTARLWFDSRKTVQVATDEQEGDVILRVSAPAYERFMKHWGLVPRDLARGNVFSIFSSMFLHADVMHLLGNMIMLYALMSSLENLMGAAPFGVCYVLWGVAAALTHTIANWGDKIPTIGASGAIAGVIGAYFIAFGAFSKIRTLVWIGVPMKFNVPATVFVVFWVFDQLLGLSASVESGVTGVAWYEHVGGFLAGAATMHVLKPRLAARMSLDRNGQLEIKDGATAPVEAPAEPEPAPPPTPAGCPHCGEPLETAHVVHDRLLRCGNGACGRLIILETPFRPQAQQPAAAPEPELEPAGVDNAT